MIEGNNDDSQVTHNVDLSQLLMDVSSLATSSHILAIVALVNVFYDKYDVRSLTSEYLALIANVEITGAKLMQAGRHDSVPTATPDQRSVHLSEKVASNPFAALAKAKEEYAAASKDLNEFHQRHPHIVSLVNVQKPDVNSPGLNAGA